MSKITYIGVDDRNLDLFEGQYVIPQGVSYNSYLLTDDKTVIMDTVDAGCLDKWRQNLEQALQGREPDYLLVSHMEPDHSSGIGLVLKLFPNIKIICSLPAQKMLGRFLPLPLPSERFLIVREGDPLQLGEETLQFISAPMVHWPEVMMTYAKSSRTLFSADAFGKFGALDYDDQEGWACEARRYYFNIVGKYGGPVQTLLGKVASLDIERICPLHGPVLNDNLGYYIGLYDTWSRYAPEEKGVFIAYCSMHGNTRAAALSLASMLQDGGLKVSTADLCRDDMAEAIEDAFRYDRLVLAAPTYEGGVMPVMADFLHHLKSKNYQKRTVGIIENGSWAPAAARVIRASFEQMREIDIVEPVVTVESTLKPGTIEAIAALAGALSTAVPGGSE